MKLYRNIIYIFSICMILSIVLISVAAHGGEKHKKNNVIASQKSEQTKSRDGSKEKGLVPESVMLSEFPTLHPLIVHFPIVLLLLAPLFQLAGIFRKNNDFKISATILVIIGLLGAILAGNVFHPLTADLAPGAQAVLERHDFFANLTFWSALVAVFFKIISHLKRFQFRFISEFVLISLFASALFVSIAGHYGATLTFIHGVGPKGEFLEKY